MKVFHCDSCDHVVFYENVACLNCGHTLAYLPEHADLVALVQIEPGHFRLMDPASEARYKLCANAVHHGVCNWAMAADDPSEICAACRLTRVVPSLEVDGHLEAWRKLEMAKRRLLFSLLDLKLPVQDRIQNPESGLAFDFMADAPAGTDAAKVLTGHDNGVITINIAEADDAEREKRRLAMHEPYRTLLGHFRHEIGHYYWDRLIRDQNRIEAFRAQFGDESVDYAAALQHHYEQGPPAQWQQHYISTYASSHPWEDWAESWAHYLHIVDALQTAGACGVRIDAGRANTPVMPPPPPDTTQPSFDAIIESWASLAYVMNNLNRSLGQLDSYPFVLTTQVLSKLRFIHDLVRPVTAGTSEDTVTIPLATAMPVLAIPAQQQQSDGTQTMPAPDALAAPVSDPATTVMAQLLQDQT